MTLGSVIRIAISLLCFSAGFSWQEDLSDGISFATAGEYEKALEIFTALLDESPEDPLLLYYVGLSHFYLEQLGQAESFLERSVSHDAEFPQAYYWYAEVLLVRGNEEEALSALSKGIRRFPKNRKLHDLLNKVQGSH